MKNLKISKNSPPPRTLIQFKLCDILLTVKKDNCFSVAPFIKLSFGMYETRVVQPVHLFVAFNDPYYSRNGLSWSQCEAGAGYSGGRCQ